MGRQLAKAGSKDAASESRKVGSLVVKIMSGGRVVQTVEIPDPRQSFCERYNEMAAKMGLSERASVN